MSFGATLANNLFYRILNVLTLFLLTIAFTRLAGVEEFGLLSLMIVNATFFNLVTSLGIDSGIVYNTASKQVNTSKATRLFLTLLVFQFFIALLIELGSYLVTGKFWILQHAQISYAWLGLTFVLSILLIERFTALLNGLQRFLIPNKVSFICNLGLLISLWLVYLISPITDLFIYFTVYVLFHCLQAFSLGFLFFKYHHNNQRETSFRWLEMKSFVAYSFISFISNVIQFVAYRADYWFIDYFRNEKELGWYALSVRLVQLFWILPLFFASILFPKVAANKSKETEDQIVRIIRGLNWINIVVGISSFLLASWFIPFAFGENFNKSIDLFRILLPGILLFCMTNIIAAYFAGIGELNKNLIGSVICLSLTLILDILLIPNFGMMGAAIASTISYSITSAYFIFIFCRKTEINAVQLFTFKKQDRKKLMSFLYQFLKRNKV